MMMMMMNPTLECLLSLSDAPGGDEAPSSSSSYPHPKNVSASSSISTSPIPAIHHPSTHRPCTRPPSGCYTTLPWRKALSPTLLSPISTAPPPCSSSSPAAGRHRHASHHLHMEGRPGYAHGHQPPQCNGVFTQASHHHLVEGGLGHARRHQPPLCGGVFNLGRYRNGRIGSDRQAHKPPATQQPFRPFRISSAHLFHPFRARISHHAFEKIFAPTSSGNTTDPLRGRTTSSSSPSMPPTSGKTPPAPAFLHTHHPHHHPQRSPYLCRPQPARRRPARDG